MKDRLLRIFETLLGCFGKRNWWPGDSPLEVMVGAILTQNTSWKNVEKAIRNLKHLRMLDVRRLNEIKSDSLAEIIRPAGFYRIKSDRLKAFIKVLNDEYGGRIERMAGFRTADLRERLLRVHGIGPETADSILLYALNHPVFVIDAYTKRFLGNHGLYQGSHTYDDLQAFFMDVLPAETYLFNEFHALIVRLCQTYCKKVPLCGECPLCEDKEKGGLECQF